MNDIIPAKKLFITQTSILRNSKKIKYKKFISHPNNDNVFKNTVRSFHIQYYYTLTFKNKSKNDTISINCQQ